MTRLAVRELVAVSRAVAAKQVPSVEVRGVLATEGSRDRAEVLVQIANCQCEPCSFVLNLSRTGTLTTFAADFTSELRHALTEFGRA